ncbi:MAG TPA: hypothetical protein VN937_05840 [Blastocatellia bacterium]|nr:hypothetical protein [Blastocatellia bacterium]
MPHLPALEVIGGSVTLKIPLNKVNAKGEVVQTIFEKGIREIECYPEVEKHHAQEKSQGKDQKDGAKQYTVQSYATPEDSDAYIYLIEISGEDGVFEFRPKDGKKCQIKVYFATEEENEEVRKLMKDRRWSNTVKRIHLAGDDD